MTPQVLYKAQAFAIRIVKAHEYLVNEKKEYRISDQLYRSGTAIAALIAEAEFAQSKADFVSKMQIALKEANESKNWIYLLYSTGFIDERPYKSIYRDINEIIATLIKIITTTKKNHGLQ